MPRALCGKVILLTGGSIETTIAAARTLTASGASVIMTYSEPMRLAEISPQISPEVVIVKNEAGGLKDGNKLAEFLRKKRVMLDKIDFNVSVSGFASLGSRLEDGWDNVFRQSVKGPFLFLTSLVPILNPGGTIRIWTPECAKFSVPSAASKAAVILLRHALSQELSSQDISIDLNDRPCG